MALITGTKMKQFFDDVDTRLFTQGYQIAEDVLGGETIMYHRLPTEYENKPKPVKVEGKCCARCVHRYGDKMDYCVRHNFDDNCYKFKLEK